MISDRELVLAAKATYDPTAVPMFEGLAGSIRVFLSQVGDLPVVAIEGTHDPIGWAIDFVAVKEEDRATTVHSSLGWLHAGFHIAAATALPAIRAVAQRGPYAICGHSLGAALAELIGVLLAIEGMPPVKIGSFAPPRVGGDVFLAALMANNLSAYRYADDPIPLVPFFLPGLPYRQAPLIQIGRGSFARALISPFTYHHIDRYADDVPA